MRGYPILFLLRHGQTDYNLNRRFQGQQAVSLNSKGHSQIQESANHIYNTLLEWKEFGHRLNIKKFLSSDLARSVASSQIVKDFISNKLNLEMDFAYSELLREYSVGDLENHTIGEFDKKYPGLMDAYYKKYQEDPWNSRCIGENSESWNMVSNRVSKLLKPLNALFNDYESEFPNENTLKYASDFDIYLWSTHGGVIGNLLELMSIENNKTYSIGNGDVLILAPSVCYKHIFEHNLQKVLKPKKGTRFPLEIVVEHGCFVSWKIIKHFKVGDSITAKSELDKNIVK